MDISVVVRGREDGATAEEILGLAGIADDLGYPELWVGGIAGYLTIGGYREMFLEAGSDEAVERAASGAELDDLVEALPDEAVGVVGLVGSPDDVRERLDAYSDAGLDEVALVPMMAGDPSGGRTLRAAKSLT